MNRLGRASVLAGLLWAALMAPMALACNPQLERVEVKGDTKDTRRAGIGDTLILTIRDLDTWRTTSAEELVLYIDGVPLQKAELQRIKDNNAEFRLIRDAANKEHREAWNRLLARPERFSMPVAIAVGPVNKPPWPLATGADVPSDANEIQLVILWPWRLFFFFLAMATLLYAMWQLAHQSGMLRDGQPKDGTKVGTFSLARCQMAWWFVIVLGSFLFLGIVLDTADTFNTTALALLGISGGTGFVSILMDRGKQTAAAEAKRKAEEERAKFTSAPEAAVDAAPLQSLRMQETAAVISKADEVLTTGESNGFLTDLLSDESGVSLHRLQILVWTLVLSVLFVWEVYSELQMPTFSATLLALMGLSSATYVGIKNTEK